MRAIVKKIVPRGSVLFAFLEAVYHARFTLLERRAARMLERYLRAIEHPFIVQIGANDGDDVLHDYIVDYDLEGILVEPQADSFSSLQRTYAGRGGLILENVAIAEREGIKLLHKAREPFIGRQPTTGLATFTPERNALARQGETGLVSERVNCTTLHALLEKHNVETVDYLQIDTEGYDYEILRTIDFDRLRPGMIRYEYVNLPRADQRASLTLLHDAGYRTMILTLDVLAFRPAFASR